MSCSVNTYKASQSVNDLLMKSLNYIVTVANCHLVAKCWYLTPFDIAESVVVD